MSARNLIIDFEKFMTNIFKRKCVVKPLRNSNYEIYMDGNYASRFQANTLNELNFELSRFKAAYSMQFA